jgi:hypothetical protein
MQADAAARSAANATTFGLANNVSAGANALLGFGGPGDLGQRYQTLLKYERARDRYDAINRPVAQALGGLAGDALLWEGGAGAGRFLSSRLPSVAKGKLGEALSFAKTRFMGDYPIGLQVRTPLSRGYTVADSQLAKGGYVESKFGPKASLSNAQERAQQELGPSYRVDWWQPKHVGLLTGPAAAIAGLRGLLSGDTTGAQ